MDEECHEVVLTSDGYPVLKRTLKESEAELELKRILKADSDCCKVYHSAKGIKEGCVSFDDRTYIRFVVEKQ